MDDKNNIDTLLSLVGSHLQASEKKLGDHPDSESLAAFVDQKATHFEQFEIKQHLTQCTDCYQQWFDLKRQVLELENIKKPWYVNLFKFNVGIAPFQFNLASVAVTAGLAFVLVYQFSPTPQKVTFELPDKLVSLDKYCEQCSAEDYNTYINKLALKIEKDCSESNNSLSQNLDQDINFLIKLHPEQDNTYLKNVLLKCKENITWSEQE